MFIKKKLGVMSYELRKRGFTLMELVLYMGLLMILLAVLSQLFTTSIESQLSSQTFSYVQQDGRFIMNKLTYDIQNASSVSTPSALGIQTTTLVLDSGGATKTYSLTGSNLLRNGIRLNGFNTSIANLTFQLLGNSDGRPTVQFAYTVTSLVLKNGVGEVKNYQTTVGLK